LFNFLIDSKLKQWCMHSNEGKTRIKWIFFLLLYIKGIEYNLLLHQIFFSEHTLIYAINKNYKWIFDHIKLIHWFYNNSLKYHINHYYGDYISIYLIL